MPPFPKGFEAKNKVAIVGGASMGIGLGIAKALAAEGANIVINGFGDVDGPKAEIEAFRSALLADPARYIAQPTLSLSTCPTYVEEGIAPRHIDLRPFVLSGKTVQMVPGGLTRVALKKDSLVVNSSQGGGTKDTWVLEN